MPWEWFSEWKNDKCKSRNPVYVRRKNALAAAMWRRACSMFPQLKEARTYFDVGTGLTNLTYIGGFQGSIYGLDHNLERFEPLTYATLRPKSDDVPGLYLTGQDILSAGFMPAMLSGIMTASAVLGRNLIADAGKLRKVMRGEWREQK